MRPAPSIRKAFEKVVSATEAALIANTSLNWGTLPKKLTFFAGNDLEIAARLLDMSNSSLDYIKNGMYPLIVLYKDIATTKDKIGIDGIEITFPANIGIFVLTDPTYTHNEREDINFAPIIRPIHAEFLKQLSTNIAFFKPYLNELGMSHRECYFFGSEQNSNTKNPYNDYLDATVISFKSLRLKNIC